MKKIFAVLFVFFIYIGPSFAAPVVNHTVNHPMGMSNSYADIVSLQELGVKQVRKASILWSSIEPQRGVYDFRSMDAFVRRLQTANVNVMVATFRAISSWGGNPAARAGYDTRNILSAMSGFPSDIAAWKDFVRTIVERYDGDGIDDMPGLVYPVKYWQVENEWMRQWKDTTANYLKFLDITYKVIKKADPTSNVIAGAITGSMAFAVGGGFDPIGYFEKDNGAGGIIKVSQDQLLHSKKYQYELGRANALLNYGKNSFDIVDVHLYSREAYRIPAAMEWLKSTMANYGDIKPVWSLENGGPLYGYTESLHAEEVVKRYLLSITSGIDKTFWSALHETPDWSQKYRNLSLIDASGRKKSAFYTYQLIFPVLDGFETIERLNVGKGIYCFKVTKRHEVSFILWADNPVSISLPVSLSDIRITNTVTLQSHVVRPTGSLLGLQVGVEPLLIEPAYQLLQQAVEQGNPW